MDYTLRVTSPATGSPLRTADVKDHLKVSSTSEDVLIENLETAAREYVENYTGRSLLTQTYERRQDDFPTGDEIELPRGPLVNSSNVSVTYAPSTGGANLTFESSKFIVTESGDYDLPRVVLKSSESWPDETLVGADAVRVSFDAGYGGSSDIPQALKQAMLLWVGSNYEHRSEIQSDGVPRRVHRSVESLLWSYRIQSVA